MEGALGAHDDALGEGGQRLADRLLALAVRVEVGGVDEVDARGDGLLDERGVLRRVRESIRAQPDPAELGVAQPGRYETFQVSLPVWQWSTVVPFFVTRTLALKVPWASLALVNVPLRLYLK